MMIPTDEMVDLIEQGKKRCQKAEDMDKKLEQVQILLKRWQKVEDMCKSHLSSIEDEGQLIDHLDDDIHYIFEAAMEATFGKSIWPKYNRLNKENSEREYDCRG